MITRRSGYSYSGPNLTIANSSVYLIEKSDVRKSRGPQLWIFVDVILESLDSWLDSEIPKSIFVIPVYQIRACGSRDL